MRLYFPTSFLPPTVRVQQTFGPPLCAKPIPRDERLCLPSGSLRITRQVDRPLPPSHAHSSSCWRIWCPGLNGGMGFWGTQGWKTRCVQWADERNREEPLGFGATDSTDLTLTWKQSSGDWHLLTPCTGTGSKCSGQPGHPQAEWGRYPWLEQLEHLPEPVHNLVNHITSLNYGLASGVWGGVKSKFGERKGSN